MLPLGRVKGFFVCLFSFFVFFVLNFKQRTKDILFLPDIFTEFGTVEPAVITVSFILTFQRMQVGEH